MDARKHICFTFAGDVSRDSRLRRFTEALSPKYRISIIALSDAAPVLPVGIDLISIPRAHASLRRSLPSFWLNASRIAAGLRADAYFASDLYTLPAAARAAKSNGARLVYDSRELYTSIAALQGRAVTQRFWSLLERAYARRVDVVCTVNNSIAEILRTRGYGEVAVIRNLPDWQAMEKTSRLRDVLGISHGKIIVLSQGGLQRGRGAFVALSAVARVPDCVLVFLGDGPLAASVLHAAKTHGVADRVFVHPAVPSADLHEWTASADIGLCLIEPLGESYRLSLPNKLFEYLAAGLPVLGSDFPEIGAVLRSTRAGIAVDPTQQSPVTEALRNLASDHLLRAQCRDNALAASVEYSWEKEKEVLMDVVKQMWV